MPEIVQTFEALGFEHNYEIILNSITRDPHRVEITLRRMIERRVEAVAVLSLDNEDANMAFRALLDFVEFGAKRRPRHDYPIRPYLVLRRSTGLAPERDGQTRPAQ